MTRLPSAAFVGAATKDTGGTYTMRYSKIRDRELTETTEALAAELSTIQERAAALWYLAPA